MVAPKIQQNMQISATQVTEFQIQCKCRTFLIY